MKKIIILIPLIFLFCCQNKKEKTTPKELVIQNQNSLKENNIIKQSDETPIAFDDSLKQKMRDALAVLKKYATESSTLDKDFSQNYIFYHPDICFGYLKSEKIVLDKEDLSFKFEFSCDAKNLWLSFEDGPILQHVGRTIPFGDKEYAISFMKKYIKERSVGLIASCLLHELIHAQLIDGDIFQGPENVNKNEFMAYSVQTRFLVYYYGGVQKELDFINNGVINMQVPPNEEKEIAFYMDCAKEHYSKAY